jgi:hypothetical protein
MVVFRYSEKRYNTYIERNSAGKLELGRDLEVEVALVFISVCEGRSWVYSFVVEEQEGWG